MICYKLQNATVNVDPRFKSWKEKMYLKRCSFISIYKGKSLVYSLSLIGGERSRRIRSQGHRFVSCHDVVAEQRPVPKWDNGRCPDICLRDQHPRHVVSMPFLAASRMAAILFIYIDSLLCAYWRRRNGTRQRRKPPLNPAYVIL